MKKIIRALGHLHLLDTCIEIKRLLFPQGLTILMYHRILPETTTPYFQGVVSTTNWQFAEQLAFLQEHAKVVSLEEGVRLMKLGYRGKPLVTITFDDGYLDNYLYAFPLLKEMGMPATIFLTAGHIGTGKHPWWDRLAAIGKAAMISMVKQKRPQEQDIIIRKLEGKKRPQERLYLDWKECNIMQSHKIRFGAHTMDHPILTHLPLDDAMREIDRSKELIEQKLGKVVKTFAYPNGREEDMSAAIDAHLLKTGFAVGVSTVYGRATKKDHPMRLRRIGISPDDDLAMFKAKLAGLGESIL